MPRGTRKDRKRRYVARLLYLLAFLGATRLGGRSTGALAVKVKRQLYVRNRRQGRRNHGRKQRFGHFVNTASTAGHKTVPSQSVYSGTKFAVRAISEGLRQEAGDKVRVTIISPGFVRTNFTEGVTNPEVRVQLAASRDKFA